MQPRRIGEGGMNWPLLILAALIIFFLFDEDNNTALPA